MPTTPGVDRSTMPVAITSGLAGAALALAPGTLGPLVGLMNPTHCRVIGLLDLVLVPGLVRGRPRWPWLAARAALNVPMVALALAQSWGTPRIRNAGLFAVVMAAATTDDVRSLRAMRRRPS